MNNQPTKTLLRQVAERHAEHAADTTFIMPTRRGAIVLQNILKTAGETTVRVKTMDEILSSLTSLRKAGRLASLTVLHRCWQAIAPENAETPLNTFMPLGEALLQDIDDAHRAGLRFSDLPSDVEAFLESKDGDSAASLLHNIRRCNIATSLTGMWPLLGPLQESFLTAMKERGVVTGGQMSFFAAKAAAELPAIARVLPTGRAVCVGFSELTAGEKAVLARIAKEGPLEMVLDVADCGIATCCNAESIVSSCNIPGATTWSPALTADPAKRQWDLIHTVSSTGQARAAAAIIRDLVKGGAAEDDIAVVVADPTLLQPMLDAMPEDVRGVNVTMGLPVADSQAASLLSALADMISGARVRDGKTLLYHHDVSAVLMHGLVRAATEGHSEEVAMRIRQEGHIRVDSETLTREGGLYALLFGEGSTGDMRTWAQAVIEAIQKTAPSLEREHLVACHSVIGQVADVTGMTGLPLLRLAVNALDTVTLPLEGEPVAGLQILGTVETRCLDYPYVIYLGASEGTLPARGGDRTVMPQSLRNILGLPLRRDYEERNTYNFWRSVARASHTWLIHDCRGEGLVSGEQTRFAAQLRTLLGAAVGESTAADVPGTADDGAVTIKKTPDVLKVLRDKYLGTGAMSASSINAYLDCRLRWWREHVLGIRRQADIKEDFDAALFGTVVHGALEHLYKPYVDSVVSEADLAALRGKAADAVAAAMAENGILDVEGPTPILADVAVRMVQRVLEEDAAGGGLIVLGTETMADRKIHLDGAGIDVRLFGIVDRLDKTPADDAVHVVDYKTGYVGTHAGFAVVDEVFDRSCGDQRSGIALQMLLYEMLMRGRHDGAEHEPRVYAMRDLFAGKAVTTRRYTEEEKARFEELLLQTLEEMFDPDVDITPRETADALCERCPLREACGR